MKCLQKEPVDRYGDVGELAHALAPFGPKNATTSASRIRIVLTRKRGSAATISHEFTKLTPPGGYEVPGARSPARADAGDKLESTTFTSTAGQSLGRARGDRHGWGVTGAIIAGLGVIALALVVLWRSGRLGDAEDPAAPPVLSTPAARPHAPIVEPIVEDPPRPAVVVGGDPTPPTPAIEPGPGVTEPGSGVTDPGPSVADPTPGTVAHAPGVDHKKRKPPRPGRKPPRAGSGAASGSGSGANAGSAEDPPDPEDDDDKWTHMTHDEKKP